MSASAPASSARLACFTATSWLWATTETIAIWSRALAPEGDFDQGLCVSVRELVELAREPDHRETRKPAGLQVLDEPDYAMLVYFAVGEKRSGQDWVAAARSTLIHVLSRSDHRPVQAPDGRPASVERVLGERVPGRETFVYIHAEPGRFGGPHITVPDLRASGEDLAGALVEDVLFLDPEVVARQVEVQVGGVAYRETSPGPCHAVLTPKNSQYAASLRAAQAADVRDVLAG